MVYGTAVPDTEFTATVNGIECFSEGTELFSFDTDHKLHDKIAVTIAVVKGSVTVGQTVVRYPALINGVDGFVHFEQPIKNPYCDDTGVELDAIVVAAGNTFTYNHITFNGPAYWEVTMDVDAYPGLDINVGNIVDPVSDFMRPVFLYDPLPNSAKNIQDLILLKSRIFPKLV